MSANYRNLIAAILLCFSFDFVGSGLAQEKPIAKPNFGDGAFEEAAEEMGELLELKWKGDSLILKRKWDEHSKKKTDEDELEDRVKDLIGRGVPEEHAKEMAVRRVGPLGRMKETGIQRAFFAIAAKLGSNSRGTSRRANGQRLTFGGRSLSGMAIIEKEDVRFEFTEGAGDERSFQFRDNGGGKVKFDFSFDDVFVRLVQFDSGKTQLIWIRNDEVNVYVGESFADFVKRNSQVAEELLFPLFNRVGIITPLNRTDPRVFAASIKRLKRAEQPNEQKLDQLIKDLDANSYQVREAASKSLTDGFEEWSTEIKKFSKDSKLSLEAKVRLKKIIDQRGEDEVAELIKNFNLLESPEFLVGALEFANDKQKAIVVKQLKEVTKQSFGTDLQAWKNWLEKNE